MQDTFKTSYLYEYIVTWFSEVKKVFTIFTDEKKVFERQLVKGIWNNERIINPKLSPAVITCFLYSPDTDKSILCVIFLGLRYDWFCGCFFIVFLSFLLVKTYIWVFFIAFKVLSFKERVLRCLNVQTFTHKVTSHTHRTYSKDLLSLTRSTFEVRRICKFVKTVIRFQTWLHTAESFNFLRKWIFNWVIFRNARYLFL